MVVMGVRMKNTLDFVDTDPERSEVVEDVRPGIDQIDSALIHQDAGHAGPVFVPAVAFTGVDDGEILSWNVSHAKRKRHFVVLARAEIEVDGDGFTVVGKFEQVALQAVHRDAASNLDRVRADNQRIKHLSGILDSAKRELQLHPHQHARLFALDPRSHDFLLRDETVIAAIDIFHLGRNLVRGADDQGLGAGVVGMVGQHHALPVQHLQDREFGQVRHHAICSMMSDSRIAFGPVSNVTPSRSTGTIRPRFIRCLTQSPDTPQMNSQIVVRER